jgi:hypothetical protein
MTQEENEILKPEDTSLTLTEEDKAKLQNILSTVDHDQLMNLFKLVGDLLSIIEGRPEPQKPLTDVNNKLEKTNFPTHAIRRKNEYLRLISFFNKNAVACLKWADVEAEGLESYQGKSREQEVELRKTANLNQSSQEFYLNSTNPSMLKSEKKKGLFQRLGLGKSDSEDVSD